MSTYFSELVPADKRKDVDRVGVCLDWADAGETDWYATVSFSDGLLYHYRLFLLPDSALLEKPIEEQYVTTGAMREQEAYRRTRTGCFGLIPDFLFEFDTEIIGQVLTATATEKPFDEEIKRRLKQTARALDSAVEARKKFVPTEQSWGIEP